MIKKFFLNTLAVVLTLSCLYTKVGAQTLIYDKNLDSIENSDTMIGFLISPDGEEIEVIGTKVSDSSICSRQTGGNEQEYSSTYMFEVYSTPTENQLTVNQMDGTYSVRNYLTVYYKLQEINGYEYCLLTKVSGYWVVEDPLVSVTGATLKYGSVGLSDNTQIGTRYPSNHYSYNTGFDTYNWTEYLTCGANIKLTMLMGDYRTWTFVYTNNPYNNGSAI